MANSKMIYSFKKILLNYALYPFILLIIMIMQLFIMSFLNEFLMDLRYDCGLHNKKIQILKEFVMQYLSLQQVKYYQKIFVKI
jgi:hypothetical protein